jgi:hypothetical protein
MSLARPVPRVLVIALYVLVIAVGLLPFAIFIDSWRYFGAALVLVAAMATYSTRDKLVYSGIKPDPSTVVLGLIGHSAAGALSGLVGFLCYGFISLVCLLVTALGIAVNLEFIATAVSAVLVIFFLVTVAASDAAELIDKLFPSKAGEVSSYASVPRRYGELGQMLVGLLFLAVVIVGTIWLIAYLDLRFLHVFSSASRRSVDLEALPVAQDLMAFLRDRLSFNTDVATALVIALSYVGPIALAFLSVALSSVASRIWTVPRSDPAQMGHESAVKAIRTLLEAIGYHVRLYPRVDDRDANAFVELLDFLAIRPDGALAGCVKVDTEFGRLGYEVYGLQPAVWALSSWLSKTEKTDLIIEPVLIVVGEKTEVGDDISSVSSPEVPVRVLRAPPTELITKVITQGNRERLNYLARSLFEKVGATARPPATKQGQSKK